MSDGPAFVLALFYARQSNRHLLFQGLAYLSSTCRAMIKITSVLTHLEQERNRLASSLQQLNQAIAALNGAHGISERSGISAAGCARIAAAQRARWARVKGQKVVSIASRPKRKMSAAAIARIRAAQKARWAKWRKANKTA